MLPVFAAADEAAVPVHAVTSEGLEAKLAALGATAWAKANAFSADEGTVLVLPHAEGEVAAVHGRVDRQRHHAAAGLR